MQADSIDDLSVLRAPISVRLDADVRETVEAEAKAQGISLASYLRQLAAKAARDVRRARIRADSAAVARHIATDPAARDFMADWGTPGNEAL
jgi:hypothetical protein